jgi:hypothetical protein
VREVQSPGDWTDERHDPEDGHATHHVLDKGQYSLLAC